jgi:hypothetical protein
MFCVPTFDPKPNPWRVPCACTYDVATATECARALGGHIDSRSLFFACVLCYMFYVLCSAPRPARNPDWPYLCLLRYTIAVIATLTMCDVVYATRSSEYVYTRLSSFENETYSACPRKTRVCHRSMHRPPVGPIHLSARTGCNRHMRRT